MESNYKQTQPCPKCGKQISMLNFEIHEAMCKGVRESFILNINDPEFKNKYSSEEEKPQFTQPTLEPRKKQEQPPIFIKPREEPHPTKPPLLFPKPKEELKPQRKPSSQEKFPCTNCGYLMTMAELDTHPATCAMHTVACPYCKIPEPEQLLEEHKLVCKDRPHPQQSEVPRPQPIPIQPRQQRTSPVSPVISPIRGDRRGSPVSTSIMSRYQNGRKIQQIVYTYADGTTQREQRINGVPTHLLEEEVEQQDGDLVFSIDSHNGRRRGMAPFPNIFLGNVGNDSFGRMVAQLMGQMQINPRQNPGLTEAQIRKLPIVKFNKQTNGKKCTNCTICIKDYNDGDVLIKLPCEHLFNKECIYPWLKESSLCPNCRGPVLPSRGRRNLEE